MVLVELRSALLQRLAHGDPVAVVLLFLVVSLALYRLSLALTSEEGPYGILNKIRKAAGVVSIPVEHEVDTIDSLGDEYVIVGRAFLIQEELPTYLQPTNLSRGVTCLHCTSFWLSFPVTISLLYFPVLTVALLAPFALGAAAILFDKVGS